MADVVVWKGSECQVFRAGSEVSQIEGHLQNSYGIEF
jgi:hypothetical protein